MSNGVYFGGVFPCIGEFNVVVWDCRFDHVGVYMCVCYSFDYSL